VEGIVGYRESWGCDVALGDPVCRVANLPKLAAEFREYCAAHGRDTVYAAGSAQLAAVECGWGAAAVEFGETLIHDPRLDPQAGSGGRELRKKVARAHRENVVVREYQPERVGREPALECSLEDVAARWLRARFGLQIYVSRVHLFEPHVEGRRWFYAQVGSQVVGVLALLRMEARAGYLLEHLLAAPASPVGIAELLVTDCFATLGMEGCSFATFGPAPGAQLRAVRNLGRFNEAFARRVYSTAHRMFHLDRRTHFQQKFGVASVEPTYIVFDPPHVRISTLLGLSRAFNVSVRFG
jgi:lysylphosphatidylglycerol synthetase-like protein (DUF2156 family)